MCSVNDLASAEKFQRMALELERSLYSNISERVAEASKALAITLHMQGRDDEVGMRLPQLPE